MIYYIFIYYHLLNFPFLPFTIFCYSFYYIISSYYYSQFGNIYYHSFHLLHMVFSFTTIYSIYSNSYWGNLCLKHNNGLFVAWRRQSPGKAGMSKVKGSVSSQPGYGLDSAKTSHIQNPVPVCIVLPKRQR